MNMCCINICTHKIQRFLITLNYLSIIDTGVKSVLVALIAGKAEIVHDRKLVSAEELAEKVTDLGFTATVAHESAGEGTLDLMVRKL